MSPHDVIWAVAALACAGVIIRPFRWPEFVWAAGGAAVLVLSGLLPVGQHFPEWCAGPTSICS